MVETLKTIHGILSRYGYDDEAAFVTRLVSLHDTDRRSFVSEIGSTHMWGGAMSIAEIDLKSSAFAGASALEKKCDSKLLRDCLVQLASQMRAAGIVTRGADDWAAIFRDWNEDRA